MESSDGHHPGGDGTPSSPGLRRGLIALLSTAGVLAGLLVLLYDAPRVGARPGPSRTEVPVAVPKPAGPQITVRAEGPRRDSPRPNIVLITADDLAETDLRWMPRTRHLLGGAGVEVANFLSNHPICCPARAEILTGQYGHNNGVHDNDGRYGGYQALRRPHETVATWLSEAGYRTAFVGKYLNGWELDPRPEAGWQVFDPLLRNVYRYDDFTMQLDGVPRTFHDSHSTDVIGRLLRASVERFARGERPFFVWASPITPHNRRGEDGWRPPAAAERHRDLFTRVEPPSLDDPAFNEPDVSDKPPHLTHRAALPVERAIIDHRTRLRSLQSLDEQVRRTVLALRAAGELDETYVFFTSDNGYLLGEHRLHGKNLPYEESLQVPLLVRGPGLPAGEVRPGQYGLVDLAPTFLDIAGAEAGRRIDGRSMLDTLRSGGGAYRHYLIQASTRDIPWWWRGVRSNRFVYVRYAGGFEELYDLVEDPDQLVNVAQRPEYAEVRRRFADRLERLATCAGRSCWSSAAG